ncbi:leucyl aminopeptidase [Aquamicrobium segne]|uniref:Probable cytosol aminopeptidase n=1 Tax=Aquamicrobium segne TaxID=469547 RepID=A0ABW0GSN3_9HYPH
MTLTPSISFAAFSVPEKGNVYLLSAQKSGPGKLAASVDTAGVLGRAFKIADFSGKFGAMLDVIAPEGSRLDRLIALGVGKITELDEYGWLKLGGVVSSSAAKEKIATILVDLPGDEAIAPENAANLAAGILLRAYAFEKYKTRKPEADKEGGKKKKTQEKPAQITIMCADPVAAQKTFADLHAVVDGVNLARDLVNEPANILGPVEFASRLEALAELGVKVEVLTEKEMKKAGMGALLGVAQGSPRGARLVVMRWEGGRKGAKPLAVVGKGVTFDTGGNSMKSSSGMEDMKGDMGGAASVAGLMHALAARKAKANVVGIVGLVENSVDGNSQRPGDIVTSMSGQTIEVLNTDAEGRLVLADALWYGCSRFEPAAIIDLATLTGAIMVALGLHHAGLFANDDDLANQLTQAGLATQERLWRMPLGADYDKLLDSPNADMKNIGGRYGGAIIAAQFLQRFVKDNTPWAHLDIAGTAMGAPSNDVNHSWGSGFGVRLLDRLVRDNYEE